MFHVKHTSSVLHATGLVAGYGKRNVIDVLDIAFANGIVTALIGPNAAGKSTLIRVLAGALRPKSGKVAINGNDIYRMSAGERARRLAYASQQSEDQFAFTVRELVTLGAQAHVVAERPADVRIAEALAQLDLTPIADRDLLGLSGGERQRAGIARALAQETEVLILDEPTAHLDLRHQAALMHAARVAASERGATVILVLHDLNLASAFADRLILLVEGKIVADGTPAEIMLPEMIESAYQTKVLRISDVKAQNQFIHLTPQVGKTPDPLV